MMYLLPRRSESVAELFTIIHHVHALMFSPSILPDSLSLQHHQTARDKTVSTCRLPAGTVILSVRSLTSILIPKEKGRRCDFCHSCTPQDRSRLQRCTGCASYWYCDSKCTHDPSETLNTTRRPTDLILKVKHCIGVPTRSIARISTRSARRTNLTNLNLMKGWMHFSSPTCSPSARPDAQR